jgi:long-subunit acyl-CoA synthetase (AMP-forming)
MEPDPSVPTIFILPTEWSVAGGELTPTLKLKRSVIARK